jgi:hypothetical protein
MDYERKTAKNTLPPYLFFLGGSGVEAFVGALLGSCCGFQLNLHVEFDRIDRFSLTKF